MTRHGRNATNSSVYTYHERKKDSAASGYGTDKARLHKDSLKGFDCCSLTLQPCKHPMITAEGWLFDKEAILKYILEKKKVYTRKLKEYERQKKQELQKSSETAASERLAAVHKFETDEKRIKTTSGNFESASSSKRARISESPLLPSFWVPSETPTAAASKLEAPNKNVYCPMSGKKIRLKDLIEVKFTEIKDPNITKKSLISRTERYVCCVSNDVLNNATPIAVLRPTGDVVTMEVVKRIVEKDMRHPLTGQILTKRDIIQVQRGGTGFAAVNDQLEATHYRPNLVIA